MIDRIDAQRLAAHLEGAADERERAEIVARLAESEEGAALLADAVAVLRELEAEGLVPAPPAPADEDPEEEGDDPPAGPAAAEARPDPAVTQPAPGADDREAAVTPIESRGRAPSPRWLALAAALAAVALAPLLLSRLATSDDPARAVALVEGAPLPAEWTERPWLTTRGDGDPLGDPALAARLGALMVDLDVAHATRDTAAASQLAREVRLLLQGVPGAAPLAQHYDDIERNAGQPDSREQVKRALEEGWELVPETVGPEMVRLGAWVEAARIAAARRDASFFADRGARAVLRRASADPQLSAEARAAAARAVSAMRAEGAPPWDALRVQLDALLRVIAS